MKPKSWFGFYFSLISLHFLQGAIIIKNYHDIDTTQMELGITTPPPARQTTFTVRHGEILTPPPKIFILSFYGFEFSNVHSSFAWWLSSINSKEAIFTIQIDVLGILTKVSFFTLVSNDSSHFLLNSNKL
jgi:hypothetical protein